MAIEGHEVVGVPVFMDNYSWIVPLSGSKAAVVDPGDAVPVIEALRERGLDLEAVLLTHHHPDHIAGTMELVNAFSPGDGGSSRPAIIGAEIDRERLPPLDRAVGDGARLFFGETRCEVLAVPGHTRGHLAFVIDQALFAGDALFSFGCGRMFEGDAPTMWASLQKLAALPDDMLLFSGHEYTEANLRFARHLSPDDEALRAEQARVAALRAEGAPTLPSSLCDEKRYNPFLRCADPEFQRDQGHPGDPVALFAALRAAKDNFA